MLSLRTADRNRLELIERRLLEKLMIFTRKRYNLINSLLVTSSAEINTELISKLRVKCLVFRTESWITCNLIRVTMYLIQTS